MHSHLALALVVIGALAAGWFWEGPYYRQWEYLNLQKDCLNYRPPEGRVVYDDDSVASLSLLNDSSYRRSKDSHAVIDLNPGALLGKILPLVGYGPDHTILFMHERRSEKGNDRLVVIRLSSLGKPGEIIRGVILQSAFHKASWKPASILTAAAHEANPLWFAPGNGSLRLFAGQPDPKNESHFTIHYQFKPEGEAAWRDGIVEGWLQGNDLIRWEITSGPLEFQ